jgi:hypothetical protein
MNVLGKFVTEALSYAAGDQLSQAIKLKRRKNSMASPAMTKPELEKAYNEVSDTLETVSTKIDDLLEPALTREAIVIGLQELEELLSTDDDDEDDELDDSDEEDEE